MRWPPDSFNFADLFVALGRAGTRLEWPGSCAAAYRRGAKVRCV